MTRIDISLARAAPRQLLHTPFAVVALTRAAGRTTDPAGATELAWVVETLDDRPSARAEVDGALRLIGAGVGRDFPLARRRLAQALREGRLATHALEEFRPLAIARPTPPEEPLGPDLTTWLEIVLRDQDAVPIPNARYQVVCQDAVVADGTLDDAGFARVEGLQPMGDYQVVFPEIDAGAWKAA